MENLVTVFMTIDPVALRLGPFTIYWYGIIMAAAVLIGYLVAQREARRTGFSEDHLFNLVILGVIFGWIGARLYYVAFNWDYFGQNLSEIYKVWHGGLAIHGGIISVIILGVIYCSLKHVNFWQVTDICAPAIILGQAIGRWGNFINQEAYGYETSVPWAMYIDGAYRHPTFLYESLWNFGVFLFLLWLRRRKKINTGDVFLSYIALYSVGRCVVEYFRTDSLMLGPLKAAQVVSIIAVVLAVAIMVWRHKTGRGAVIAETGINAQTGYAGKNKVNKPIIKDGKVMQAGKTVKKGRNKKKNEKDKAKNNTKKKTENRRDNAAAPTQLNNESSVAAAPAQVNNDGSAVTNQAGISSSDEGTTH